MRKVSFEENLRHRLHEVPRFHYRDESSSSQGILFLAVGAVAGIAAGVVLAQRYGGLGALTSALRERFGADETAAEFAGGKYVGEEYDDEFGGEPEELSPMEELEERVLEAYHNDPVLSERAVDIGAIDEAIIELTGWVYSAEEAEHAVTVARGTPGVDTVVNRLAVRVEEDRIEESAEHYKQGDDQFTEAHWEGQRVGTGRTRQGHSGEPGRHADPKVDLEDRWMSEEEAYREAADAVEGSAERRTPKEKAKGGRNDGSQATPMGVPKADHVAKPEESPQYKEAKE
ncbi:MAG: BON domain-containing protein [Gemmatimonadaceae bacterium]